MNQHVGCFLVLCQRRLTAQVHALQQGFGTQIAQQQKAVALLPGQYLGHAQAGLLQQLVHFYEGLAVFLVGRRVHDHQTALRAVDTQIASKAGIGRGQAHAVRLQVQIGWQPGQPSRKLRLALRVGPVQVAGR